VCELAFVTTKVEAGRCPCLLFFQDRVALSYPWPMLKGLAKEDMVWILCFHYMVRAKRRCISARSNFNECGMNVPVSINTRSGYMQDESATTVWAYSNSSRLNRLTKYTLSVKSNFGSHSKV
jgi:hypothetical protein